MSTNGSPSYPDFLKPYLEQIRAKIPSDWIEDPSRKGGGWRWVDPNRPNHQVRIDPGRPEVSMATQQQAHVIVNYNGRIIGRNGQPITESIKSEYEQAHIPLQEWLTWRYWYLP